MSKVFVRSISGNTVTLSDNTQVGAVPVLVDMSTIAAQNGVADGLITVVSDLAAEILLGMARITQSVQNTGSNAPLPTDGPYYLIGTSWVNPQTGTTSIAALATYQSPNFNVPAGYRLLSVTGAGGPADWYLHEGGQGTANLVNYGSLATAVGNATLIIMGCTPTWPDYNVVITNPSSTAAITITALFWQLN